MTSEAREGNETIRELAKRMALENDVHVDLAERAVRNLIARGLIALAPPPRQEPQRAEAGERGRG